MKSSKLGSFAAGRTASGWEGFSRGIAALSCVVLLACASSSKQAAAEPVPQSRAVLGPAAGGELVSVADVVDKVLPSVVSVSASKVSRRADNPLLDDPFFRRFFGPAPERQQRQQGLGSGVVVSGGYILTNNHVVEGAEEVRVSTSSKRSYDVEVVGTDPKSDLAVLRVKGSAEGLVAMTWGDSAALRLGDPVVAVGNPFGLGQTVTKGIVSAKGRADLGIVEFEDFIQTDAAINPGNSGGALVNSRGELVGINTAILSRSGGSVGIGFAIPAHMARPIMDMLISGGKVTRGYLGVLLQDLEGELVEAMGLSGSAGALVADVVAGGPAERAGLQRGDVVVEVNGAPVSSTGQLRNAIAMSRAGSDVTLTLVRKGARRSVTVKVDERPAEPGAGGESDAPQGASPGAGQGFSGMRLQALGPEQRQALRVPSSITFGAVVQAVEPGSNAARAGLRPGDVIVEAGQKPFGSLKELGERFKSGKGRLVLLVYRDGGTRFVAVAR